MTLVEPTGALHQGGNTSAGIGEWLVSEGLRGAKPAELLSGLADRLIAAGFALHRMHIALTALHPQFGGQTFSWNRADGNVESLHFPRRSRTEGWLRSPFFHMMTEGALELREPLASSAQEHRFPVLDEFRAEGATDYYATMVSFSGARLEDGIDPDDPPEGMLLSCTSDAPAGFSQQDLDLLRTVLSPFALALKSATTRQMAEDLLATYLGPDAGARVLSGTIQRGTVETIHAVIMDFDLQGFTHLSEEQSGEVIVELLNEVFGVVVAAVEAEGGNVLKFMGDGLLAIFPIDHNEKVLGCAVSAAKRIRTDMASISERRAAHGLPMASFGLGLHGGDLMYGNIGAENRLDFTIIGPAVNATARIQEMCRSQGRQVIMSSEVAVPLLETHDEIVSLGRFLLRGVREPQELFTLL